jgi:hypothetical protein
MSAHPPPVPPEQRSPKGTGGASTRPDDESVKPGYDPRERNLAEQGRQGAVKQNTTNKGYQQDR